MTRVVRKLSTIFITCVYLAKLVFIHLHLFIHLYFIGSLVMVPFCVTLHY